MKDLVLRALYFSGLLGLYHRWRNKYALTVISLHRVIAEADNRWKTCDPLYTISVGQFRQCLEFFKEHYSTISLNELRAARKSGSRLPPRPLLITFDDGWADNYTYALPVLQQAGTASVLFVASEAIDRKEAFFQEKVIAAWRRGLLTRSAVEASWARIASDERPSGDLLGASAIRQLVAALQTLPMDERDSVLVDLLKHAPDNERHMLTSQELRAMWGAGVEIGTHGKQHEPLTDVEDVDEELNGSRRRVAAVLGIDGSNITSLSFPFSRQNADVVNHAISSGYDLLFGGGRSLTPVKDAIPCLIARVGITASEICDTYGNVLPHRLANELFRQRHFLLEAGRS